MEHTSETDASPADVEAVTSVATEYFQSWFAGDGERMRACLHPAPREAHGRNRLSNTCISPASATAG